VARLDAANGCSEGVYLATYSGAHHAETNSPYDFQSRRHPNQDEIVVFPTVVRIAASAFGQDSSDVAGLLQSRTVHRFILPSSYHLGPTTRFTSATIHRPRNGAAFRLRRLGLATTESFHRLINLRIAQIYRRADARRQLLPNASALAAAPLSLNSGNVDRIVGEIVTNEDRDKGFFVKRHVVERCRRRICVSASCAKIRWQDKTLKA
jgi:hypothetical protein